MKGLDIWGWVALALLIIGGINWGFVGLFRFDIVETIFGGLLARLIYILVAVAALYMIYLWIAKKKE